MIWMTEYQAYGNTWNMVMFSVNITEKMVKELIDDGYLEEGDFNESYFDETDADYSQEMAQPVLNAIIDWYLNQVDEWEDKIAETGDCEEQEMWESMDELHKMEYIATFENWKHCSRGGYEKLVEIHQVDPESPYKGYLGGF